MFNFFWQDEDRIFTNLYGRHDWKLKGAIQRVNIFSRAVTDFLNRLGSEDYFVLSIF